MTAAKPTGLARGESAQGYVADPRNDSVLVYVNGEFVRRDEARVSIFDSGFVASCNSTNFFVVRGGELWTSTGDYSFKGITQRNVIEAWRAAGGVARECDFTLAQVYSADEAFVTGTLGGVTPVTKVDGRTIGSGKPGAQTARAGELYLRYVTGSTAA